MTKDPNIFDKSDVFEKECRPILDQLILECRMRNIACFFCACVKNDADGSDYVTHIDETYSDKDFISDAAGTGSQGLLLTNDKIVKHIAVEAGFDVIPHRKEVEIPFDTIDSPEEELEMDFSKFDE